MDSLPVQCLALQGGAAVRWCCYILFVLYFMFCFVFLISNDTALFYFFTENAVKVSQKNPLPHQRPCLKKGPVRKVLQLKKYVSFAN